MPSVLAQDSVYAARSYHLLNLTPNARPVNFARFRYFTIAHNFFALGAFNSISCEQNKHIHDSCYFIPWRRPTNGLEPRRDGRHCELYVPMHESETGATLNPESRPPSSELDEAHLSAHTEIHPSLSASKLGSLAAMVARYVHRVVP